MVSSRATTVDEYLASLPPDRRAAISTVRNVVRASLPLGYEEGMQYGMIGWYIPLSRYPNTYNGQPLGIAALASQKDYMSLYLYAVYGDPNIQKWFVDRWASTGKKLDMGKSCVRFTSVDDLVLDLVGETIARVSVDAYLAHYERVRANTATGMRRKAEDAKKKRPAPAKAGAAKKTATKKKSAKRAPAKKPAPKKKPAAKKKPAVKKKPAAKKKATAKKRPAKKRRK